MTRVRSIQRFDLLVVLLTAWMLVGGWLDNWAHHWLVSTRESFFTPWHAVLYTGFAAVAAVLVGTALLRRHRGEQPLVPPGYGVALVGVGVFAAGGVVDMFWHLAFGVEVAWETLVSPSHLWLATGAFLIGAGPVRAARHRPVADRSGWSALPAILSVAYLASFISFFTEYANPLMFPWPSGNDMDVPFAGGRIRYTAPQIVADQVTLTGIAFQGILLAAVLILLLRLVRAPVGAVTLVVAIGFGPPLVMHYEYRLFPALLAAGVVGDALLAAGRAGRWPIAAADLVPAAVPPVLTAGYLATLAITDGLVWSTALVTGAVAVSAAAAALTVLMVREVTRYGIPPES